MTYRVASGSRPTCRPGVDSESPANISVDFAISVEMRRSRFVYRQVDWRTKIVVQYRSERS
jgi:hypothetical protein